jgi:hypothetical protein
MGTLIADTKRKRDSHVWDRATDDWYIEPTWCSERLFAVEGFYRGIHDPACGTERIVEAARRAGLEATGSDLIDRGFPGTRVEDFFTSTQQHDNVVCNPPFSKDTIQRFALHALAIARRKVAIICPVARLNAAHWLRGTPLRIVWLLSPRPSMPPGSVIATGEKPGGGKVDFCWLVFEKKYRGPAALGWLHRDGGTP